MNEYVWWEYSYFGPLIENNNEALRSGVMAIASGDERSSASDDHAALG